jgi:hypothetical protein
MVCLVVLASLEPKLGHLKPDLCNAIALCLICCSSSILPYLDLFWLGGLACVFG